MEQQHQWEDQNSKYGYIKNMVYRTDIDHPNSMHNQTTKQSESMRVQFPQTNSSQKAQYTLNGYYDKNPASLKNGFTPHSNQFLEPVDKRLMDPTQDFNQNNENNLYKPNEELLREITQTQKDREFQRTKRL